MPGDNLYVRNVPANWSDQVCDCWPMYLFEEGIALFSISMVPASI